MDVEEPTGLNASKEEEESKNAEYTCDLRFRVSIQLIGNDPCLEDTSRIEETGGWKQR
jgi:hypothetical protein